MSIMVKNGSAVDEVSVKLASTAAVAADKALVVALHPSSVGLVAGNSAHSAGVVGNPLRSAGKVVTAVDTTLVANDTSDLAMTTGGAQVVALNSVPDVSFQYTGVITTSTQTALRAAQAAGIRNYITDLSLQNTHATVGTIFLLQDGSTTIWQCYLPPNMLAPVDFDFRTPKRGTAATATNFTCSTTGANVLVNGGGFAAP